jgi:Protein of unknown function (DUF4199)
MTGTMQKKIPVALLYGGIASICIVLYTVGTWRGGISTFIGGAAYGMYLIPLCFAIAGGLAAKKRGQGFIGFRATLQVCFGIIVLALAIQMLFTWILLHVIDPRFGRELAPAVLLKMEATYRHFGMPEDEIARNIEASKDTDPFGFSSMCIGLARNYIVGFLIAALMAGLIKHKAPAGMAVNTQ